MADWVEKYNPYTKAEVPELRTGTVLRKVPFSVTLLGSTAFGSVSDGKPSQVLLSDIGNAQPVRSDKVEVSSGVVLTPDCDIFQHKCNAVCVAQMISPEDYIHHNSLKKEKADRLRADIRRARTANPGSFNFPGLFLLLGDPALDFPDSLVLLENHISLPIEFPMGESSGARVTELSVGNIANLWFRISHPELRIRLINEYARQMMRVGLADA